MTRILVIDDHEALRAGVKALLENSIPDVLINEAWDGDSGLKSVIESQYDLVILDINIPGTDSIGLVSSILGMRQDIRILMFSMNAEEIYAKRYLQLGVKGYVSKNAAAIEIIHAVKDVLENKKYISPALKNALVEDALGNNSGNPFKQLSPRELQICQYLIKGKSSADIASILNLKSSTVGTHKDRLMKKLKCKSIIELSKLARLHNMPLE